MDKFDRVYQLHKILSTRRTPILIADLQYKMECSRATVYRFIQLLTDKLGAPIKILNTGVYYDQSEQADYELPGLWFNASEIYALLVFHELIKNIQPGFLQAEIEPLKQRIERILEKRYAGAGQLQNRIRILGIGNRHAGEYFQLCTAALVERKRLATQYHSRSKDQRSERVLSPQRLVYYRNNWYLDAYCHSSQALRTFSLERFKFVAKMDKPCREIGDSVLDEHFTQAYGIFAGEIKGVAVLKFTPQISPWLIDEQWHPQQQGKLNQDGSYELTIPFSDARELMMDILKYGADVEVIAPGTLRQEIEQKLQLALHQYKKN